eukprot:scaffold48347_cov68-Phaeocystis_antarctica.AAC.2
MFSRVSREDVASAEVVLAEGREQRCRRGDENREAHEAMPDRHSASQRREAARGGATHEESRQAVESRRHEAVWRRQGRPGAAGGGSRPR